jgi:hypothetical protein
MAQIVINKHSGRQTLSLAKLIDAQEKLSPEVHPPATGIRLTKTAFRRAYYAQEPALIDEKHTIGTTNDCLIRQNLIVHAYTLRLSGSPDHRR